MKRIFYLALAALLLLAGVSCNRELNDRVDALENRVSALSGSLAELQTMIEQGFVITSISEGEGSYTIAFSNGKSFTIRDGKNGTDGVNGKDGKDGDSFIESIEFLEKEGKVLIKLVSGQSILADYRSTIKMIDDLVFVPMFNDGKAQFTYYNYNSCTPLELFYEVYPESLAETIASNTARYQAKVKVRNVMTRASSGDDYLYLPTELTFENGMLRALADPGELIKASGFTPDHPYYMDSDVEAQLIISDGLATKASPYCQVISEFQNNNQLSYYSSKPSTIKLEYMQYSAAYDDINELKYEENKVLQDGSFSVDLEYSIDNLLTWKKFVPGEEVSVPAFTLCALRGFNPRSFSKYVGTIPGEQNSEVFNYANLHFTGANIKLTGSVMALVDRFGGAEVIPQRADAKGFFFGLFAGNDCLMTVPSLTAKTLTDYCYSNIFRDCTSLVEAPAISCEKLSEGVFKAAFKGCSRLEKAPELPFLDLQISCYYSMFEGCSRLETAPELPAESLDYGCYAKMFKGCTSLVNAPDLPSTSTDYLTYYAMFQGCTSLVNAPRIDAEVFFVDACLGMFNGCTALKYVPDLKATCLEYQACSGMFKNCTSLEDAPAVPVAFASSKSCYQMFENCQALKTAPELPATELGEECYLGMFGECRSLVEAPALPAETLAPGCYTSMFAGCTSLEKAPVLPAKVLQPRCYMWMFLGCEKLDEVSAYFTTDITESEGGVYCYTSNWLNGVAPSGRFHKSAAATWDLAGTSGVPEGWEIIVE